jgi:hypothetical protein
LESSVCELEWARVKRAWLGDRDGTDPILWILHARRWP